MKQHIEPRKSPVATGVNGHILVAEDDVVGQIVTVRMLEQAGYQVDLVIDGLAAIEALKAIDYDLIIMDCSMPGMDGFATTRAIRNAASKVINPKIPVIALTALTMHGDRQKCLDAGMDEYVIKTVESSLLIAAVERCLGRAGEDPSAGQAEPDSVAARPGGSKAGIQAQPVRDVDFLDSIIDPFLEEIPQQIFSLQAALGRKDVAALRDIAHRLRGSAAVLGASALSNKALALENAVRTGDFERACKRTPVLIKELQNLLTVMSDEQDSGLK